MSSKANVAEILVHRVASRSCWMDWFHTFPGQVWSYIDGGCSFQESTTCYFPESLKVFQRKKESLVENHANATKHYSWVLGTGAEWVCTH